MDTEHFISEADSTGVGIGAGAGADIFVVSAHSHFFSRRNVVNRIVWALFKNNHILKNRISVRKRRVPSSISQLRVLRWPSTYTSILFGDETCRFQQSLAQTTHSWNSAELRFSDPLVVHWRLVAKPKLTIDWPLGGFEFRISGGFPTKESLYLHFAWGRDFKD